MENSKKSKVEIQEWLSDYMAEALKIDAAEIKGETPFKEYGLDSSAAVILTGDLGEWLGYDLEPTLLVDYQTLDVLSSHLAQE